MTDETPIEDHYTAPFQTAICDKPVMFQEFTQILQNHYCGTSENNDFHAALLVKSIMLKDAILLITKTTIKLRVYGHIMCIAACKVDNVHLIVRGQTLA